MRRGEREVESQKEWRQLWSEWPRPGQTVTRSPEEAGGRPCSPRTGEEEAWFVSSF